MRKGVSIIVYSLTILSLCIFTFYLIFGQILLTFIPSYEGEEYYATSFQVTEISFDDSIIIIGQYFIDGENYNIAISNDISSLLQVGDEIDIIYGNDGFGDSFEYPIVMIAKGNHIFLDETIGTHNLINERNEERFELMVPIYISLGVFVGFLGLSIYYIISRKKH
ncbi:MAG: hypothetical protein KKE16_00150 [Firmicutes bacterium]|nr:hypothetical protein [Bacillota bacterium]